MFPLCSHISKNYSIFPEVTDDVITSSGPCKPQKEMVVSELFFFILAAKIRSTDQTLSLN